MNEAVSCAEFEFICRILMRTMNTNELVAALDTEIRRLTQIRDLLADVTDASPEGASQRVFAHSGISSEPRRRGRPKGSKNKATSFDPEEFATKRSTLSAAGKERIAAAQRARWAKQKETGAGKKSRTTVAKAAAAKSSGLKNATKKVTSPRKKSAASPQTKSAAPSKAVNASKAVRKGKPAKKVVVRSAVKKPAKKAFAPQKVRVKSPATPSSTPTNASAEKAITASAE